MKKQNHKQLEWSRQKVLLALRSARVRFLMLLVGVLILPAVTMAITDPTDKNIEVAAELGGTGVTFASMALVGNIDGLNKKYSTGNQIGYKVYLVAIEQVDTTVAYPTANASRELGTIPLKAGEYMHYFNAIHKTLKDNSVGEDSDISFSNTNTFSFTMAGNPAKLMDFIEEFAGEGFIVIYQECETLDKYVLGSLCKPMILKSYDRKNDPEAKAIALTFENSSFTQALKYTGNIVTAAPTAVAGDSTNLAITDAPQYQLTAGAGAAEFVSVSGLAAADYGRTIDVLGITGGANPPTIADNAVFILKDGVTWTANVGSRISFRILDDSTLVEIDGTRIQT